MAPGLYCLGQSLVVGADRNDQTLAADIDRDAQETIEAGMGYVHRNAVEGDGLARKRAAEGHCFAHKKADEGIELAPDVSDPDRSLVIQPTYHSGE